MFPVQVPIVQLQSLVWERGKDDSNVVVFFLIQWVKSWGPAQIIRKGNKTQTLILYTLAHRRDLSTRAINRNKSSKWDSMEVGR